MRRILNLLRLSTNSRPRTLHDGLNLTGSTGDDPQSLSDELARNRLMTSGFVDEIEYHRVHPDVRGSGMSALGHYSEYGYKEGRRLFSEEYGAGLVGSVNADYSREKEQFLETERQVRLTDELPAAEQIGRVVIFVHSKGNYFMFPIADTLKRCLEKAGAPCDLRTELGPEPKRTDVNIVVAPHEFFENELPDAFASILFRTECLIFNTEQIPSRYFHLSLRDIIVAKGVIDVSFQSYLLLKKLMPAMYMLPGFDRSSVEAEMSQVDDHHPLFLSADVRRSCESGLDQRLEDRTVDIFYAGFANAYRDRFFVKNVDFLAERNCFLAYTHEGPSPAASEGWKSVFPNNLAMTSNAKIVLAIHRYATGFIEWERMVVQGFASGALVVGTPGIQSPHFAPGEHYLECPLRHMGLLLKDLLESEGGLAKAQSIADRGRQQLWSNLSELDCGRRLVRFIKTVRASR